MKFTFLLRKNIFNLKKYKMNKLDTLNTLDKTTHKISYLNSEQSKVVDDILMSPEVNFSIDQLMEIAGLSVAIAINKEIDNKSGDWKNIRRILNISGPGSIFF
jgi:hypothetical protein